MAPPAIRNLRCHYGGIWAEGTKKNLRAFKYSGGEFIDDMGWNVDEVNLLDLNKWVQVSLGIPHTAKLEWFWLQNMIRHEMKTDRDVLAMWNYMKPDTEGLTHLYINVTNSEPAGVNPNLDLNVTLEAVDAPLDDCVEGLRRIGHYNISQVDADEMIDSPMGSEHGDEDLEVDQEHDGVVDLDEDLVQFCDDNESLLEIPMEANVPRDEPGVDEMEIISRTFDADDKDDAVAYLPNGESLFVGQAWDNVYEARDYLRLHGVVKKFRLYLEKNDSDILIARCKNDANCPWRCYVRRSTDKHTMKVKKVNLVHSCEGNRTDANSTVGARWIATKVEQQMRLHHKSYTPQDIIQEMWHLFQLKVKYWQAWHARAIALERVHGNYNDSYTKVPELCRQILLSNPDSVAKWARYEHFNTFTSVCIAFKSSIDGFITGCRPLIGLDGCFLKGKFGGALLSMVALDGNNGIFPLAIYIGRGENFENWSKFLEIIQPYLSRHPMPLTMISDRQKGLVQALPQIFPECSQRFCFRHMYANLKRTHRGLGKLVWGASRCYKQSRFRHIMEEVKKINSDAHDYLMQEDPKLWARSYFDHITCSDHNTNNFSEAFNAFVMEARDQPIVKLVGKVQSLMTNLMFERNQLSSDWDDSALVPRVIKDIKLKIARVRDYTLTGASQNTWQVNHHIGSWWIVDLEKNTCTCVEWQVSGIPCVHAVCVIHHKRENWARYCNPYFKCGAFKATYNGCITPILPEEDWDEVRFTHIIRRCLCEFRIHN